MTLPAAADRPRKNGAFDRRRAAGLLVAPGQAGDCLAERQVPLEEKKVPNGMETLEEGQDGCSAEAPADGLSAEPRDLFRHWLKASSEWSRLNRSPIVDANDPLGKIRRLRELERRMDAAAEAYAQAQYELREKQGGADQRS